MKQLILGLFSSKKEVDSVLSILKSEGLPVKDVSLIASENHMALYRSAKKNTAGEGALTGGILGGLAGLLIAATPVLLPGVGIFAVGPAIIFTGFAMGAVTGGLLGALVDLGISTNQARRYEKRIKEGGILLAVPTYEEQVEDVQEVMENHKAEELTIIPYKLKSAMSEVTPQQA